MGKAIKVSDSVYRRLANAASREGVTIGVALERLLEGQLKEEGRVTPEERESVSPERLKALEGEIEGLKDLEGRLRDIEGRVRSLEAQSREMRRYSIGSDIRKRFECEECGARGFVAMRVECTECGRKTWWGWWSGE